MSVAFLFCMNICVCECLLKNNIAGVPSSRTTSGFPQYCVFICVRFGCTQHASLWIPNQRRKTKFAIYSMVHCGRAFDPGTLGFLITAPPSVCIPEVFGVLAVRISKPKNKKKSLCWYSRGLCLCPCMITPRGFTSLPTLEAEYSFPGFKPTIKRTNKNKKSRFGCVRCVFMDVCFVVFLFCLLHLHMRTSLLSRSIAGVPFDSGGRRGFRATLLLHTTCMRSWCDSFASCVAA